MGLLSKINEPGGIAEDFTTFCNKYSFIHAGLLSNISGTVMLTKAFNIDAESHYTFVSSADFWEGTIKDCDKWLIFNRENNSINPFLQLFSDYTKSLIESISFIKFIKNGKFQYFFVIHYSAENNYILPEISSEFLIETSISSTSPFCSLNNSNNSFNEWKQNSKYALCVSIDFSQLLNTFYDNYFLLSNEVKSLTEKYLIDQLLTCLLKSSQGHSFLVNDKKIIKSIYFSESEINIDLFIYHLNNYLSQVIIQNNLNNLVIKTKIAISSDEISIFLGK